MKAVDFVVELSDKVLFIEIKEPQHPRAKLANATSFINGFQSGKLARLCTKYAGQAALLS